MDYEALRQQADLRLSQELTRIRNLPKKSKTKMVNTYGLKHASHTNAGLLKGLDTDLSIINREQRRVVNDLNKRRRAFAAHCQRTSLPPGLAPMSVSQGSRQSYAVRHRKISEGAKSDVAALAEPGQSFREIKKGKLTAMAERSKSRTLSLIRSNSKKFGPIERLPPLEDSLPQVDLHDSFFTRLVNRKGQSNTFKRSCFPSLLAGHTEVDHTGHSRMVQDRLITRKQN